MPRGLRWSVLFGSAMAGVAAIAAAQSPSIYDGSYVGELTLAAVNEDRDCTPPPLGALYPLTISRGEVRFAYIPRFSTTLIGRVAPDGSFQATARLKHGSVQMTGRVRGVRAFARIVSPSCNYNFESKN